MMIIIIQRTVDAKLDNNSGKHGSCNPLSICSRDGHDELCLMFIIWVEVEKMFVCVCVCDGDEKGGWTDRNAGIIILRDVCHWFLNIFSLC